jgi:hypothetical protein
MGAARNRARVQEMGGLISDRDRFELFYWSSVNSRWTAFENMVRKNLMLESARETSKMTQCSRSSAANGPC